MSKDFSFFIKKDGKYIPFKFYTRKWDNGNSVAYYYLNKEEEREKLDNRWKVLYHCGKKFIANEETENQMEATPNDVVVYEGSINWKAIISMCALGYILPLIRYVVGLFWDPSPFMEAIKIGFGVNVGLGIIAFGVWLSHIEDKRKAKEWNAIKIPEEKLLIRDLKQYDLVIEDTLENLISVTNQAVSLGYVPKGGMLFIENKYLQPIYKDK